jgi:hypothetical protein
MFIADKTTSAAIVLLFSFAVAASAAAEQPAAAEEQPKPKRAEYGTVWGLVINDYGDPVSGALVVIKGANRFANTNGEGYYVIRPFPAGTFEMKVSRIGYDDVSKRDVKVTAGSGTNVNFILGKGLLTQSRTKGVIEGRVVDATGYPLKRVRVRVLENEAAAETDADGAFSFGPLEPGFYTVRAECACYLFQTGRVLVAAGEITPVQFVLWADPRWIQFGL